MRPRPIPRLGRPSNPLDPDIVMPVLRDESPSSGRTRPVHLSESDRLGLRREGVCVRMRLVASPPAIVDRDRD